MENFQNFHIQKMLFSNVYNFFLIEGEGFKFGVLGGSLLAVRVVYFLQPSLRGVNLLFVQPSGPHSVK